MVNNMENIRVNVNGPMGSQNCIYKTIFLKENLPLSEQIIYENTKYVVKWNFDLGGTDIQIPKGCLIEFDGGSISNGNIACNNTIFIYNQEEEIVLKNVELTGDYEMNVGGSDKKDNINGMGRITLKKSKDFTKQFIQDNTIYAIRHNFDLNNKSITIPENCVLEFNGGSICNGTLILDNDTQITSIGKAFGDNVTIVNGSHIQWNILWFGAKSADGSIYNEQKEPINGYTPYEFLIPEPENDIAPVIQRMFDAQCYDIYIPKGNYYWGSTVTCDHNVRIVGGYEKLSHDHVISEGYWRYDDNVQHDYFPRESIKVLRRVETMLFIGDPNLDEIWSSSVGEVNHRRSLTFSNLNIKCYRGSMTAILNGWIDGAEIHDNNIIDCGYLVDYPKINDDPNIVVDVPTDSGLWKVPKIYDNFVGFVHGAVFRCNIVDGFIHDNYFNGNGYEIVYNCEQNTRTNLKNHSVFVDCYHWNNINKTKICNNFIDFFYVVYRLTYNCDLSSSNNQYDITSCVFSGTVHHNAYTEFLPYIGTVSSINDSFSNINNWEGGLLNESDWNFEGPFPKEKKIITIDPETQEEITTIRNGTRYWLEKNNDLSEADGRPQEDGNGYYRLVDEHDKFITSCYSIFQTFPKELTFIPASLLNVEYIYQGKEYKISDLAKTHYLIGGRPGNFHYGQMKAGGDSTMVFIPALQIQTSNIKIPDVIINHIVDNFVKTENYIADINSESKAGDYRKLWSDTYINSIKTDFSNQQDNIIFVQAVCNTLHEGKYRTMKMPKGSAILENLVPNTTYTVEYFYTDYIGDLKSVQFGGETKGSSLRLLNIEGTENVRDLGGWECDGGHVGYGRILRGGGLDYQYRHLTEKGRLQLYEGLKCRMQINTTQREGSKYIDRPDVSYVYAPIEQYQLESNKVSMKTIIENIIRYTSKPSDPNTNPITTRDGNFSSVYIHCDLGKDRTGTVCIILLSALGVSESDILKDYDISYFFYSVNKEDNINYLFPRAVDLINDLKNYTGGNGTLKGGAEAYLLDCGLSSEQINIFRRMMVE